MGQVFISYRRRTSEDLARRIHDKLKEKRISSFLDTQNLRVGPFNEQLYRAIADSDVFLCILAEGTLESVPVQEEIEFACKSGRPIIPIFQNAEIEPDPAYGDYINQLLRQQGIKIISDPNLEEVVRRVKEALPPRRLPLRTMALTAALVLFGAVIGIAIMALRGDDPKGLSEFLSINPVDKDQEDFAWVSGDNIQAQSPRIVDVEIGQAEGKFVEFPIELRSVLESSLFTRHECSVDCAVPSAETGIRCWQPSISRVMNKPR